MYVVCIYTTHSIIYICIDMQMCLLVAVYSSLHCFLQYTLKFYVYVCLVIANKH